MGYRIFDHTADLGVEVDAATREELYADAVVALFDLLTEPSLVRPETGRELVVDGNDPADLLVNFLREALYLWNGDGWLVKTCAVRRTDARQVTALLHGESFDPARHRIKMEIKAVTYHQVSLEQGGDGWKARIVFDV